MLKKLKEEFALLCLACKDKRMPLVAKILAGLVVYPISFYMQRKFVFVTKDEMNDETE